MYGTKRIVLSKDGFINRAGSKTWHPIGKWSNDGLSFTILVLRPEYREKRQLTPEFSEFFRAHSKSEARKRIVDMYKMHS